MLTLAEAVTSVSSCDNILHRWAMKVLPGRLHVEDGSCSLEISKQLGLLGHHVVLCSVMCGDGR